MKYRAMAVLLCGALASFTGVVTAQQAKLAISDPSRTQLIAFDIPSQPLATALPELGRQADIDVVFYVDADKGALAPALQGRFTTEDALKALLGGTGLTYHYLNAKTVTITSATGGTVPGAAPAEGVSARTQSEELANQDSHEGSSIQDSFRVAQAGEAAVTQSGALGGGLKPQDASGTTTLEEVVVTAQKREERLQDVPVPVSVINSDVLAATGQTLLQDYYSSVPGLVAAPSETGGQVLSIRGVTTGDTSNNTINVLIDDVPVLSSWVYTSQGIVPNVDPGDLARIEVLRGPQGTLYGASSMGGLIKYVTLDPSTDRFSARVEAGVSGVSQARDAGYDVRGGVNVPLTDTLAVRFSAFKYEQPGYVDNPGLSLNDVNETRAEGARLVALWKPIEDLSLKLSASYQLLKQGGSSDVTLTSNDSTAAADVRRLVQVYPRGSGDSSNKLTMYVANLNYKFGGAELISNTGYIRNIHYDSQDFTYYFGSLAQSNYQVSGSAAYNWKNPSKFSQELRLELPLGQRVQWLIGGFYTRDTDDEVGQQTALDPVTGQTAGLLRGAALPTVATEWAAFTDLTFQITDQFDVQIGGRESHTTETDLATTVYGPLGLAAFGASPFHQPAIEGTGRAFTYLFTPRYKLSPDLMLYARLASGYRAGGPNTIESDVPPTFAPDRTYNYEVGLKGEFLGHVLLIDTSVYYIDWRNIQLPSTSPTGYYYIANAGSARSDGVEFSTTVKPLAGLSISAWFDYDDAVLTQPFPPGSIVIGDYGVSGDPLPFTSRYSGNLSANQDFPLWRDATGFVGISASYIGNRMGPFQGTALRQYFPAYTKTDLRAGVKFDTWTVTLYANNVADKRGVVNGGLGYFYPSTFLYTTPRTVGLDILKRF